MSADVIFPAFPMFINDRERDHAFGEPVTVKVIGRADRTSETIRCCEHCGLRKITAYPPDGGGFREWRDAHGRLLAGALPCTGAP